MHCWVTYHDSRPRSRHSSSLITAQIVIALVLATAATLLMAGTAIAVTRHLPAPELTFTTGQPTSTNNNDTCDIGVTPAATLLLPYFEVDTAAATGAGATTLWTITNTSRFPQIAHVTVWTDWSFPVLDFRSEEHTSELQSLRH